MPSLRLGTVVVVPVAVWLALSACGDDASPDGATPGGGGDGGPGASSADAASEGGSLPTIGTVQTGSICNKEGFCWESPRPHGFGFTSLWASGPSDVWAVTYPGAILHFDGSTWTPADVPTFGVFSSVWGSGPNDIWVAGYEYYGDQRSLILHFDGKAWSISFSSLPADPGFHHPNSLWGSGPTDIWAVGDANDGALHYDGVSWSAKDAGTAKRLRFVVGSSKTNVWAMPEDFEAATVALVHYDGLSWSPVETGQRLSSRMAIWVSGDDDVWMFGRAPIDADAAAGDVFTILHFDGEAWKPVSLADLPDLSIARVWGSGPKDIWAAGSVFGDGGDSKAFVLHYDGNAWASTPLGAAGDGVSPACVGGAGPKDVWVCDNTRSTLLHWDGAQWASTARTAVTDGSLGGVWGAAPNDVWTVGAEKKYGDPKTHGVVAHYDGAGWVRRDVGDVPGLSAAHGAAANDVWAVGQRGTVLHFDGGTWTSLATGTAADVDLAKVWAVKPDDVWIAGAVMKDGNYQGAAAFHWDGRTWTSSAPPQLTFVRGLWASGKDDVWLTGHPSDNGSGIFHFDGQKWDRVDAGTIDSFGTGTIWGSGPKDVWIGTSHFDGAEWKSAPSDFHVQLHSIVGKSTTDLYTVSAMGEILHYDGARWSLLSTVRSGIGSLAIVGNDLLATGIAGSIVRKKL